MTDPRAVPHGAWPSVISSDMVAAGGVSLSQVEIVDGDVFWIEGRPSERGRSVIVSRGAECADLTPAPYDARSRVHEYGGGAFLTDGRTVVFANLEDQRLYRQDAGGEPRPITPEPTSPAALRYADGRMTPDGRWILCVRENHEAEGEAVAALVAVPADGRGEPRILVSGRTFYSFPRIGPDGSRLAWTCWDHPRMPWDGTELWVAELSSDATVSAARLVAGGPEESVFQPAFAPDGRLHFVSDRSGWWNLYAETEASPHPLAPMDAEFGVPQWVFGLSTYAFLEDGGIACVVSSDGREHLGILSPGKREPDWLDLPYTSFRASLRSDGRRLAFIGASTSEPAAVVVCDVDGSNLEVLRRGHEIELDPCLLPEARAVSIPVGDRTTHALLFPPRNPAVEAPEGTRPPLIVRSHGGPTSAFPCELDLGIAYWTSRGFAVLLVNYGGSTGYGRAYRNRLRGRWGLVDVEDCVAAARRIADLGEADPDRLLIRGGSAGGFTTLCALAFFDAFAAGASAYGVADMESLATDTHKFEARYLDSMIGPYPETRERYRERSPIHAADRISCPVIFFQGLEDRVVPPSQTEVMVGALRDNGVPVACLTFEGEGHGFRKAETIRRVLEAELAFYGRVLGFTPADDIEPPGIANLA